MSRIWGWLFLSLLLPRLAAAAEAPPARSTIYLTREPAAIERFATNDALVRRMVDRLVIATTGAPSVAAAWRSLIAPGERIGIKVDARGGRDFSTHPAVVAAIVAGLESAGHARRNIIVWDRSAADLAAAGFVERSGGYRVRAIEPPAGYDPAQTVISPVSGKLIWGDLDFRRRGRGLDPVEEDQLSAESHWARVLGEVTKIINVPTLTDSTGTGIAGALYNATVPNIDNWRRFAQVPDYICDLYTDSRVGPKVVLHLMDGLIAQYAGGPGRQPAYSLHHATLYASRDPVALDATALRQIEKWRVQAELPPIGQRGAWLQLAEAIGIGWADPAQIDLIPLRAR